MTFAEHVRQALYDALDRDPRVVLLGVGITTPGAMWNTLDGLYDRFGPDRVIEGPLSEAALTGMCIGLATQGYRPVLMHHRIDFTLLGLDQFMNHAAKLRTMFGGQQTCPMVIRAVVGRSWGNGPQHTQSLHGLYAHIPGIKVVVPSFPHDAYTLMQAAIADPGPVMYIEHRWLHGDESSHESENPDIGRAEHRRCGMDVTVVASGPLVNDALRAAELGLPNVEVIDLRTLKPIDYSTILSSVRHTGRLVVADPDWPHGGVAAEIVASVAEAIPEYLKAAPIRVTWPDAYVPSSWPLEQAFYPGASEIQAAVLKVCGREAGTLARNEQKAMVGPF